MRVDGGRSVSHLPEAQVVCVLESKPSIIVIASRSIASVSLSSSGGKKLIECVVELNCRNEPLLESRDCTQDDGKGRTMDSVLTDFSVIFEVCSHKRNTQ